jgi:hypothetical protein
MEPGWGKFVIILMKTKISQLLLAVLLGLGFGLALQAAPESKPDPRADVIFFERERFTDVRDSYMETPRGRDAILAQIKDYIVDRAKWYVPEDSKLTVTINDVDLAGDFEPERGVQFQDIRMMREIYPPRIKLSYKLVDASGSEVQHGTRELTDLMYLQNLQFNPNDPLRFEKALLDDWLRTDFKRVK